MQAQVRAATYLRLHQLTGSRLPVYYRRYLGQDRARTYPDPRNELERVLRHALTTVPYYRDVAGAGPERIGDPVVFLGQLPVLTKETIRREGDRLTSSVADRASWYENTSGGSTGEPVRLVQDADHRARIVAIQEVYSTWAGGGLGHPELFIWGSERDLAAGTEALSNRVANRLLNRSLLNAFKLDEPSMRRFLDVARRGPPKLVITYAQAGYEVARFAAAEGIELPAQLGVISTGGMLYDEMRTRLEECFGCPVFNRYGSREIGDMAGECEHANGLHILPWCCYVEVLGDDGQRVAPGVEGELVVTGLTNAAMPLIRYQIGDRAISANNETCACGRSGPRLASLVGRTVDSFLTPTGTTVAGGYFVQLLATRAWVRQFQVLQHAPTEIEYRVIPRAEVPVADRTEIAFATRMAMGDACRVSFQLVDTIEPSPSGKRRYTLRLF